MPPRTNAQETIRQYLSGKGPDDAVAWDFFCTGGMNSGKWTTIKVPSCWEQQGFGKYNYGFDKDSVRGKEKGLYKKTFDVPSSWKNKIINIVFEGVMTDAEVKVNGQVAGLVHQGAYYAFKYDITKLLQFGKANLLEVTVAKHSANESVNNAERKADFWIFGGIYRPVYLEVLPQIHITSAVVNATADGNFNAFISTTDGQGDFTVHASIYNNLGKLVANVNGMNMNVNAWNFFMLNKKIPSPLLWSPEFPNLYKVVFSLVKNGTTIHSITKQFGFRTVELKQRDGIYVNGVKVKMRGVNRSPFRPETGRTLSKAQSIEDVLLMKDMNMNAVRCSHYPPDDHFLDACDSLGLFVMDELCGWHWHYDTPTGTKLLKEMMDHDANHPSIIMWSNGNEGGHNLELDSLFTQYDVQKRPVIHPWQLFNGIDAQHYREYNYGIGNYENGNEIVMPTEFLHGQFDGGHGAGLEDYWERMWNNPLSAGGFLWDFVDQGIMRKDKNDTLDTDKFHAADGIMGPHFEKEGSYYAIKEIWCPVHFIQKKIAPQLSGSFYFDIENRFSFTNLKSCSFTYRLLTDNNVTKKEPEIKISSPDIVPGQKGKLHVILPDGYPQSDVLNIYVRDQKGKLLLTKSFPMHEASQKYELVQVAIFHDSIQLKETDSFYMVKNHHSTLQFNKHNGLLVSVLTSKGVLPLSNGPVLAEGVNNFGPATAIVNSTTGEVEITTLYDRKEHYNTLKWTISLRGDVKLEVNYFPGAYYTNFAGINFSFPEKEIKSVTYFGYGPYRVWKNRLAGGTYGVWKKNYNNTETGESWNYPEFKGFYKDVHWCTFETTTQHFSMRSATDNLYLRLFTPAWKTDQWHNYEPLFPSGDISFLQGISSIGTKTQRNETTGPMGMKNIFYDYEKDPSRALHISIQFDFNNDY
ncbi:MAG: glycoside hydrolase family 2 [Bacteroidetes bacterium]|nr:glycoside hydrolase family 2 [Bacteroidota bacterium]